MNAQTNIRTSFFSIIVFSALMSSAQELKFDSQPTHNWVWEKNEQPELIIQVRDTTGHGGEADIKVMIREDREDSPVIMNETSKIQLDGGSDFKFLIHPSLPDPGFYQVSVSQGDSQPYIFNIGISPEEVVSPSDSTVDLQNFRDKALAELASGPMNATMIELPETDML